MSKHVVHHALVTIVFVVSVMTFAAIPRPSSATDILPPISQRFGDSSNADVGEIPNFQRHVMALIGRLGCNGRTCHGSFQGRGGFRLSMFGYDFSEDHKALLSGDPLRVNPVHPEESLILHKPTDADLHEGGKRFDAQGWEARVLRAWIVAGAKNDATASGKLIRIEVTPTEFLFSEVESRASLSVVAIWDDGTREDVAPLSRFSSNDPDVAMVDLDGVVTSKGKGDTSIVVSYDNAVVAIPVLFPLTEFTGSKFPDVERYNAIDNHVARQLQKLGIVPSEICSDAEFLRRVSLDIAGTLPTPDDVITFVADPSLDKRQRKIDELLESPAYAVWWTTKFCDVMGMNGPLQLGSTEFGPIITEQWRSWIERKIRDNLPYDKLVEAMVVAVSRQPDQSYDDYATQMTSFVLAKAPADFTASNTMPHFWFRGNLGTANDKALAFAYTFMGVRLDCAQCHKHPFDRWSQQDFKQFAAIFERVRWGVSPSSKESYDKLRTELGVPEKLNTAAIRRQTYWRLAAEGKRVPWPEVYIESMTDDFGADRKHSKRSSNDATANKLIPKLLGDAEIPILSSDDPRRPLMAWLRKPDNPYFAKALVNRFWAHYFGRGLVEPADDLNLANPASNPRLFDALATDFIERGYDMKWLHREITRSATYQRSWKTNSTNQTDERHFSRRIIRRLPAEVAVDAMLMATGSTKVSNEFLNVRKGRRIGVQPTADLSRTEFSLAVFGKPLRSVNCDCEREQQPSLSQALFVRNDQDLHTMFNRSDGWFLELSRMKDFDSATSRPEWIRMAYLRTLSREPDEQELSRSLTHFESQSSNTLDGLKDLVWVLLNTREFITNH